MFFSWHIFLFSTGKPEALRTSRKTSSGSLSLKEIIVLKGSIDIHGRRGDGAQGGGAQNRHDLLRNPAVYFQFDNAVLWQLANRAFKVRPELCSVHISGMQIELNHGPGGQFMKSPAAQPAGF
jgi:hypothetical protein